MITAPNVLQGAARFGDALSGWRDLRTVRTTADLLWYQTTACRDHLEGVESAKSSFKR
jgi:hypothetical protein